MAFAAAPTADPDIYSTNEDTPLTVAAPGVLQNDADADGDSMSVVIDYTTTHGTTVLMADGSFTYTPEANYSGTDTFGYRTSDGSESSAVVAVTITIEPVNDAPVAINDMYSTAKNTALIVAAPGILEYDTDIDSKTITAELVTDPTHGTLILDATGAFAYTPVPSYHGNDSFTYRAFDGSDRSGIATVNISVNSAPLAFPDAYTVLEDSVLSENPGVVSNDVDADGDTLIVSMVHGVSNGILVLAGDGHFTYTPDPGFHGTDSFDYNISDGYVATALQTVTITVTSVNDLPTAGNDAYRTNTNTVLTLTPQSILDNDDDLDGDTITAVLVTGPTHGTLILPGTGAFTYTPDAGYHGTDSFTYRAFDGSGNSGIATVTIMVNCVPAALGEAYSIVEDNILSVVVADGVLANDNDADGDALTVTGVFDASHGTVVMTSDGSFTYTPGASYHGTDTFVYRVTDGLENSDEVAVTITVTPVEDAPVAVNDVYTVDEDTTLTIAAPGVLGNDNDADGDTMTASVEAGPAHGTLNLNLDGSLSYSPGIGYHGTDSFTYQVTDGKGTSNTATVTITVNPVNDVPLAFYDSYPGVEDTTLTVAAPGVLGNDNDPDGDALTAVLVTGPASGTLTLDANGHFVYVPGANYHGTDSFTYRAFDGTAYSDVKAVTLTVNSVNDGPIAYDDVFVVQEDDSMFIQSPGVLINDVDNDGNALSAYLVSGTSHGSLTLYGNGSFSYKPSSNYYGQDSFTYKSGDGSVNSSSATVRININSVNDQVSMGNIAHSDFPAEIGVPVRISVSFADADQANTHTARIFWGDGEADWGQVSENYGSGTITGEYTYRKTGSYVITVMVMDGGEGSTTKDSGWFDVVTAKAPSNGNSSSAGTVTPTASVPAIVSPTPETSPTPQVTPATALTSPLGGWQTWAILAAILGLVGAGAAYLILYKRKG